MNQDLAIRLFIGSIIFLLFGTIYFVRTQYYDGTYKCGIDENELCTHKTTMKIGIIAIFGLWILLIDLIYVLLEETKFREETK